MVARVIDHPFSAGVIPTPYNPDPALLAIVEIIRAGLVRDQHVRLHQFGTFRLRWSKERRVKHPKTGASITVPPSPRITFTPAKQLREWIEPNRKPVIPLDGPSNEPPDEPTRHEISPEQIVTAALIETPQTTQEHRQHNQTNLQETVQDIIDEQYSLPDNLSGITNSQTSVQADTQTETSSREPHKPNKKWALGLLAAVPLIVFLLQSDFTNKPSGIQKSIPTETPLEAQTELTPEPALNTTVINNKIIRAEDTKSVNQQSNTANKPEALITTRSEPTPKPFYMSPQVHTIQQGENLWSLAEQFYGDALLWPHIYRANTRTLNDPDKIITGKNLVIPGLQESPEFLSHKDRDLITEGYFMVYEFKKANDYDQAIHFLMRAKHYSFEWLRQNKSRINGKDWKLISK